QEGTKIANQCVSQGSHADLSPKGNTFPLKRRVTGNPHKPLSKKRTQAILARGLAPPYGEGGGRRVHFFHFTPRGVKRIGETNGETFSETNRETNLPGDESPPDYPLARPELKIPATVRRTVDPNGQITRGRSSSDQPDLASPAGPRTRPGGALESAQVAADR